MWRCVHFLIVACVTQLLVPVGVHAQASLAKARIAEARATEHYQSQRYAEAEALYESALAMKEAVLGSKHLEVAVTLAALGDVYYYWTGRTADALPLYERAYAIRRGKLGATDDLSLKVLQDHADTLFKLKRYGEAETDYRRLLADRKRVLDPEDRLIARSAQDLADTFANQGRHVDAEPLSREALAIREKVLGLSNTNTAYSLNQLAWSIEEQGRLIEAYPLLQRALEVQERVSGPNHPQTAFRLRRLSDNLSKRGNYNAAEPLLRRAIAIYEAGGETTSVGLADSLQNLAVVKAWLSQFEETVPLLERALSLKRKALPDDDPSLAETLRRLAGAYLWVGRERDAEPLYRSALSIRQRAYGTQHPAVAESMRDLAYLLRNDDRATARRLYEGAIAIDEVSGGSNAPQMGLSLIWLSSLKYGEGQCTEAEPLALRALAIYERTYGPEHAEVVFVLNGLGDIYFCQRKLEKAAGFYRRALETTNKLFGSGHSYAAKSYASLAGIATAQNRDDDALDYFRKAKELNSRALGPRHAFVAYDLNQMALIHFRRSDWVTAASLWKESVAIVTEQQRRNTEVLGQSPTSEGRDSASLPTSQFTNLIKAMHRLPATGSTDESAKVTFSLAQQAMSSQAAKSLVKMAVRGASTSPALATLVRERQDLVDEWQRLEKARIQALAGSETSPASIPAGRSRLNDVDARLTLIDARLAKEFPEYATLVSPQPITIDEVQAALRDDEALVLFLDMRELASTPEETFVWAVTKTNVHWVRSEVGTAALKGEVAALRCGLDYDGAWGVDGSNCAQLLNATYTASDHFAGKLLPFDVERAHALYRALFGSIEEVIKNKHLLIVPSGALTQLPFQVLVTEKPDLALSGPDTFRHAAWLIRSHALTVLPSVSSLNALRRLAKESHAGKILIGFGNPLLKGPDDRYVTLAAAAQSNTSCSKTSEQRIAAFAGERRGVLPLKLRSGLADAAEIRSQVPLPETADELCAVAHDLNVGDDVIRLGPHATESEVKRLSEAGELAKYRIIHFATHGALAGQVSGNSEPGLILTPPATVTERDDGYLSASEIAALKLDADWVILSACNTAAGGTEGAEALSGLARAFFYAGARALLVSHWAVASDPTVKLITGAVERLASDRTVGRAEAMRQSMLAMVDKGEAEEAHPAFWAPFVVVGEGAASG
jgi:CHAT domain-containing protein/tetratricopeptide (TPR) repeat protein